MKKWLIVIFSFLLLKGNAQDYFEDLKGTGTPVLFKSDQDKWLFVARLTTGDNSAKVNLFKHFYVNDHGFPNPGIPALNRWKLFMGAGAFCKAKIENGLGSVFSSAQIAPGFSAGAYYAIAKRIWRDDGHGSSKFSTWTLIFTASISGSAFQLY